MSADEVTTDHPQAGYPFDYVRYVRKPFEVKAVEITRENIEEVARMIGELRGKDTDSPHIAVNRNVIPNLLTVHLGFYMTMMGRNIRCFSPKVFSDQFQKVEE